jgi:hypothetical protein
VSAGAQMPPVIGASNAATLEARSRRVTSAAGTQLQELSHGDLAYSYNSLGHLYGATGRHADAEKAYVDALAFARSLPPTWQT